MAKLKKTIAKNIAPEEFDDFVNEYLEQLKTENDIKLFERRFGNYYYMNQRLVHEISYEKGKVIDETYAEWSVEEKNFVMNVLCDDFI